MSDNFQPPPSAGHALPPGSVHELYPFLFGGSARRDDALAEVRESTLLKCGDVVALRQQLAGEYEEELVDAAAAMAAAFARGNKLLAFGNGGSATDAQDAAADCALPAFPGWRALPALSLVADIATITAIANDVGFESTFLRQIIAFGEPGDIALGVSTSGNSPNVLAALTEAKRRGLVTVALAGDTGGAMARAASDGTIDHLFVARTSYTPRIQEGHATVWHTLLELVQELLKEDGA